MTVRRGFYPVYLYYRDLGSLLLSYGVSEEEDYGNTWPVELTSSTKKIATYFGKDVPRYGDSFAFKGYSVRIADGKPEYKYNDGSSVTEAALETDLSSILENYKKVIHAGGAGNIKMTPEQALEKWLGGERANWPDYGKAITKYLNVQSLLKAVPTEKQFLAEIGSMLGLQASEVQTDKFRGIFLAKQETGVEPGRGAGPRYIKEAAPEYVTRLRANGYTVDKEAEDKIIAYLVKTAEACTDLFKQPWSNYMGSHYKTVNGNKYVKLLKFIDAIRTDNREELKKYGKLEFDGDFADIPPEQFSDEYKLYNFGMSAIELYCHVHLHKPGIYICNNKTGKVSSVTGANSVDDYTGLFKFFEIYDQFVKGRYKTTWLDKQETWLKAVGEGVV